MLSKRPLLFTIFGTLFLAAGLITALGIVMSLNLSMPVRGEYWGYLLMNLLLAYGFFTAQSWLVPVLAFNWLAGAVLAGLRLTMQAPSPDSLTLFSVSFLMGGALFYLTYRLSGNKLRVLRSERTAMTAFVAVWAATACYTMVGALA